MEFLNSTLQFLTLISMVSGAHARVLQYSTWERAKTTTPCKALATPVDTAPTSDTCGSLPRVEPDSASARRFRCSYCCLPCIAESVCAPNARKLQHKRIGAQQTCLYIVNLKDSTAPSLFNLIKTVSACRLLVSTSAKVLESTSRRRFQPGLLMPGKRCKNQLSARTLPNA